MQSSPATPSSYDPVSLLTTVLIVVVLPVVLSLVAAWIYPRLQMMWAKRSQATKEAMRRSLSEQARRLRGVHEEPLALALGAGQILLGLYPQIWLGFAIVSSLFGLQEAELGLRTLSSSSLTFKASFVATAFFLFSFRRNERALNRFLDPLTREKAVAELERRLEDLK